MTQIMTQISTERMTDMYYPDDIDREIEMNQCLIEEERHDLEIEMDQCLVEEMAQCLIEEDRQKTINPTWHWSKKEAIADGVNLGYHEQCIVSRDQKGKKQFAKKGRSSLQVFLQALGSLFLLKLHPFKIGIFMSAPVLAQNRKKTGTLSTTTSQQNTPGSTFWCFSCCCLLHSSASFLNIYREKIPALALLKVRDGSLGLAEPLKKRFPSTSSPRISS
jgi:hypothetical protein